MLKRMETNLLQRCIYAFFIKQNSKTCCSGPAWQIKHGHAGPFSLRLVLSHQECSKPHKKTCSPVSFLQTLPLPTPSAPSTEKSWRQRMVRSRWKRHHKIKGAPRYYFSPSQAPVPTVRKSGPSGTRCCAGSLNQFFFTNLLNPK